MLPEQYNSSEVEKKWQTTWESVGLYKWDKNESRENSYVIDTPPPTVSGLLHMGHIFSYTQADFIARFQRMYGKNVFYPIGFDDNGLPTERLVEKVKGVKAGQMDRAAFIELCEEVVAQSEEEFRELFKSTAMSFDWTQEYQTISPRTRKISQMSFMDLLKKGVVERKYAPTTWDPADRTAIAQAEIEDKEKNGVMNYITFKLEDGSDIQIATTRPELIPACVAVFYNPSDERFKHLDGKFAITPVFGAKVKIIADEAVDIEKGTGLVMCCTFGDITDVEWWRKHNLELKQCINLAGRMQNAAHLNDMTVKEARTHIIEQLKELGQFVRQEDIVQFVKCAERSGAPVELIATKQWYIQLLAHKDKLLEKAKECTWRPDYMRVRIENWIHGLNQDWCISRQRYFGVPFPVWYSKRAGEEGKVLLPEIDQLPVDPLKDLPRGYTRDEVEADTDVMDTWATSSISPQLNSHAISNEFAIDAQRHGQLFPADLRPQAHEIIRTWAFYTIVKAYFHEQSIPWKNLMISGWCLAADKTKMSKSKGNVVTPRELIVEKSADVVRYWASNSKLGVDIIYSEEIFKIGKKLSTKLWNATKFVAIHFAHINGTPSTPAQDVANGKITETLDKWILSRLKQTIEKATSAFLEYEYADARVAVEDFFWNDFCDNYLELMKVRIYSEDEACATGKQSAIFTVYHCLKTLLRLLAPIMPHMCEELNSHLFADSGFVNARGSWPKASDHFYDESACKMGVDSLHVIELIRKYKSNSNISLRAELSEVKYTGCNLDASIAKDIQNAANAKALIAVENITGESALISGAHDKIKVMAQQ